MNQVNISGNLGIQPEIKISESGKRYTVLPLAIKRKDKEDFWVNFVFFDDTAENAVNYLKKGEKILVQGRLDFNIYEDEGREMGQFQFIGYSFESFRSKPKEEQRVEHNSFHERGI